VIKGAAGDQPGFVQMLVDHLLDDYGILDSILDEPVGSRWLWDEQGLEYVPAAAGVGGI
jgi:hypothetical protein